MWELKDAVGTSRSLVDAIARSRSANEKMENRKKLQEHLGETDNVKLPSTSIFEVDGPELSSSPLHPASPVNTDSASSNMDSHSSYDLQP